MSDQDILKKIAEARARFADRREADRQVEVEQAENNRLKSSGLPEPRR